ncbi:amidophosphoribosyltransferase [Acidobacteria bacterium AH-259-D05]|nr:amidophosphoribosyltransferase [Acidobacteria bacterium AH-259-D05]
MNRVLEDDKFHDECGVFAIASHEEAARHTYLGLYALQHRGQESAGIISTDGSRLYQQKGMGYVADVFNDETLSQLLGTSAIGHVRYSTTGETSLANAQPIVSESWRGPIALSHNGNLLNSRSLRQRLESEGAIFQTTSDTEVVLHLLARCPSKDLDQALQEVLHQIQGAYSMLMQTPSVLYAIRDPFGVRPLCLGRLDGSYTLASETCAFDLIGAEYIRDVVPGEVLKIKDGQLQSFFLPPSPRHAHCIFEHVYFSRPDSRVFNKSVHQSRYQMGRRLAREAPVDADLVVPVPDSGVTAALGYADESEIPFKFGLIRNHYVGRTFIEPKQSIRHFGVKIKLNPVKELLEGQRVILVDDSIVRGTTSRKIVEMVRSAGAQEVHLRISSPPTVSPCYYGIDTPTHEELIGVNKTSEEIREFTGADTLTYLSLEGMKEAVSDPQNFCSACFDLQYPIAISQETPQKKLFELDKVSTELMADGR